MHTNTRATILSAANKLIEVKVGTLTLWYCDMVLIAFKASDHSKPLVWNGRSSTVTVPEYLIDQVDGKGTERFDRKTFSHLFNVVMSRHNLH